MDPLTISTATASLVVIARTISVWLFNVIGEVRNVDAKIVDLAKELKLQETLLLSMEKIVRECESQALTLAYIDENIWDQIWKTIMDCEATLDKLDVLIKPIIGPGNKNTGAGPSSQILKKPGMLIQFKFYRKNISAFSDKVYKSNTAIQMALSVIHISLTFRTNASQEDIFQELQILSELVEKALAATGTHTLETLDHATAHQDRHLRGLTQSARRFHIIASTAASTRPGLEERQSTWGGSEQGDLSDSTREHIEQWNQLASVEESQKETTIDPSFAGTSNDGILVSQLSPQLANTAPKELEYSSRHIQTLHGHTGAVRTVAFSPSGRIVVSGSDDATIRTWEVVKGGRLQQLQEIGDLGVWSVLSSFPKTANRFRRSWEEASFAFGCWIAKISSRKQKSSYVARRRS